MQCNLYQNNLTMLVLLLLSTVVNGETWPEEEHPKSLAYQSVSMEQFSELEAGFDHVFASNDFSGLMTFYHMDPLPNAKASDLETTQHHPRITLLKSKRVYGWGVMEYAPKGKNNWFLQVSHRYHDKWTADIAADWWQSAQFKAVMLNSVHRYAGRDKGLGVNTDFSSAANNPMLAASRAFVSHFDHALVFQLHGFSKAKRKNLPAQQADVILSYGVNLPTMYLAKLHRAKNCIASVAKVEVLVFPAQINELGGTTNVIGQGLRQLGFFEQFIHIELSREIRKAMNQDPRLSAQVLNCIVDGVK